MTTQDLLGISEPLADPANAKADIVFVHGLNGGRRSTWTHEASGVFWPKDLLPKTCPEARILTFGYNSGFLRFFGLVGPEAISHTTIGDHSAALLADLTRLRVTTNTIDRPLFIVAHSLGGLVVANALSRPSGENTNIQRLLDATRGIMFFGTPFEGSSVARWGALIESFLGIFTDTNPKIIKSLKKNSGELMNINHQFEKFIYHRAKSEDCYTVDVATFFEAISLKVKGAKVGRIVEQESARIVGIDPIDIDADHREMCRFDDSERTGYMRASGKLANWINALDNTDSQSSRYDVYQGPTTFGTIKGNRGVITANVYTPATNGIKITASTNYYGHTKSSRKKSGTSSDLSEELDS